MNTSSPNQTLRRTSAASLVVIALLFLTGCNARFGPGFSMHDKSLFADSPHIALRTVPAGYSLRWQYGTWGFYFHPRSKLVDGQLCFSLQATSSSGALSGQYSEIAITDPNHLQALKSGGAFWLEPDGKKIRLEERKL
jgi:hypothetical protein